MNAQAGRETVREGVMRNNEAYLWTATIMMERSDTTATMFEGIRIWSGRVHLPDSERFNSFLFPLFIFLLSQSDSLLLHSIQSCLDNKRHSESVVTQPPAINSLPPFPRTH